MNGLTKLVVGAAAAMLLTGCTIMPVVTTGPAYYVRPIQVVPVRWNNGYWHNGHGRHGYWRGNRW